MTTYFAYGSNMDPERMSERKVVFHNRQGATLLGFKLTFRKRASQGGGVGFAAIEPDPEEAVEGVAYEIDGTGVRRLDRCEGYPAHYDRREVKIALHGGTEVRAFTYFPRPDQLRDGLKPTREYLQYLLTARDVLPERYVEWLASQQTLD